MSLPPLTSFLPSSVHNAFRNEQVLITGGLGFIGSNLAHALVDLGAHVTILDALLEPYGGNTFNVKDIRDQLTLVDGDIRDAQLVKGLVAGSDYIFHLAGQISYIDSKEQPLLDLDANGRGNLTILEAIRSVAPKARILFSSSRLVYGRILSVPVAENHSTEPLSLYGIHKLLGEKYYSYYARTSGVKGMSIRIPNPYGPKQQMKHNKYSIVGWFVRQAMDGQKITIFGDGAQERDYIYIDDIVDAMLRLIVLGEAGEVYNVGSHERLRFVDMVDAIIEVAGSGSKEYLPWPENYEKNETGDYIADTTKIESLCDWSPRIDFRKGVQEMIAYYKEHREQYW
jgi:UDP-glucose 4-epimerase